MARTVRGRKLTHAERAGQGANVLYTGVTLLLYLAGWLGLRRWAGAPPSATRPSLLRETCGGVKSTVVPVPVMGGPAVGSPARLGVEASARGRGPAPAALPRSSSIKLAVLSQGCSSFSGRSSEEVCGEIAGGREIAENR